MKMWKIFLYDCKENSRENGELADEISNSLYR